MASERNSYYIESLDGLRALAILFVLLFHVELSWMQGGFIGVDVFFVISGFLITSNILRDIERGDWSFRRFYIKRIARLLPALFTVVLLTLLAAYFVISPDALKRLANSSLYAVFSLSNFFFYGESGYFDHTSVTKPLLHTWSLSVEEQFYLVWPLLLLIMTKIGSRMILLIFIAVISVISLLAAVRLQTEDPSLVFFMTPLRTYQFGIGALIAITGVMKTRDSFWFKEIVGVLSVLVLIVLASKVSDNDHLLLTAVLPAVVAGGFILASDSALFRRIFASAPMVWIGQRSYSIYLVHWPIIVLWKIEYETTLSSIEKAGLLFASFVVGYILHDFVERRYRLNNRTYGDKKKRSLLLSLVLLISIVAASVIYKQQDGFPGRFSAEIMQATSGLGKHWVSRQKELRTKKCNLLVGSLGAQTKEDYDRHLCLEPEAGRRSFLVIGDSYASGAYLLFSRAYPDAYIGQLTVPGCRLFVADGTGEKICPYLYDDILRDEVFLDNYDGVIITSNWHHNHLDRVSKLLRFIRDRAPDKKTIMLGQRIRFDTRLPSIVVDQPDHESATRKANGRLIDGQVRLNDALRELATETTVFLDLIELQCPEDCDVFTPTGELMYLDDAHFSLGGVHVISERLRSAYPGLLD